MLVAVLRLAEGSFANLLRRMKVDVDAVRSEIERLNTRLSMACAVSVDFVVRKFLQEPSTDRRAAIHRVARVSRMEGRNWRRLYAIAQRR